jgi:pantothenate kinase-related protein Tda10
VSSGTVKLKSVLAGYQGLLAQMQKEHGPNRRPLLIAIDGPDGVGKSSLASWLAWQLEMPSLHLDVYLVRDSKPQRWRTDDLERAIRSRLDLGRPVIIEGVLLLDVLEQIGRAPEFLVYVQREDENEEQGVSDLHKSLIDYRLRRKPERRANFILPAAIITWCP